VPGATFNDVAALVSGAKGRVVLQEGDLTAGLFWAGQVQGLIHDIPTCRELIERIIREATEIVDRRIAGFRDRADGAAKRVTLHSRPNSL
jgi:NADH:quinone reductase (non-electrogenic)